MSRRFVLLATSMCAMALLCAILLSQAIPGLTTESLADSTATVVSNHPSAPANTAPMILGKPMTLRLDNYLDIVDSVLSAGAINGERQRAMPNKPRDITTPISVDDNEDADSEMDRVVHKSLFMRAADPGALATRSSSLVDEPLIVTTDMPLHADGAINWPMPTGRLSIVAADGSRIELDANNGDPASADITITNGSNRHRLREPWSVWFRRVPATRQGTVKQ